MTACGDNRQRWKTFLTVYNAQRPELNSNNNKLIKNIMALCLRLGSLGTDTLNEKGRKEKGRKVFESDGEACLYLDALFTKKQIKEFRTIYKKECVGLYRKKKKSMTQLLLEAMVGSLQQYPDEDLYSFFFQPVLPSSKPRLPLRQISFGCDSSDCDDVNELIGKLNEGGDSCDNICPVSSPLCKLLDGLNLAREAISCDQTKKNSPVVQNDMGIKVKVVEWCANFKSIVATARAENVKARKANSRYSNPSSVAVLALVVTALLLATSCYTCIAEALSKGVVCDSSSLSFSRLSLNMSR